MTLNHDKFKPPTCIPIRSDDIEYAGDTPYYIGVRSKELAVYPWPEVTVNTREQPHTCLKPHGGLTYMEAVYGITIRDSTYIENCYRDPEDDPDLDDNIPPEAECERLTDYGGAEVKQGWLSATITNWPPAIPEEVEGEETPPTTPIPLQSHVRKPGNWKLSTEEKELKFITIIEVGLLEALQVNINSTLAKCNVYGYNGVYLENSALHESVIESDKIIHLDNMCQVKSDLVAPYIMLDKFTIIEGDSNVIDATRYLHMKECRNFGMIATENEDGTETTSLQRADYVGGYYVYGISNIAVENTPCIKIDDCSLSGVNLASPQMGIRRSDMNSCTLEFSKTTLEDDDLRNSATLEYTYVKTIDPDLIQEYPDQQVTAPTDKLREGMVIPKQVEERLYPPVVDTYIFQNEGTSNYIIGCTTKPGPGGTDRGQTLRSIDRMAGLYPYATDISNTAFAENRRLVLNPQTQEYNEQATHPDFPYHSLTLSNLDFCTVEAASWNFYSAANNYNNSSVVADILHVEGGDSYLNNSSLECNQLKGWRENSIVDFGGGSTATITQASKSIRMIAGFGSELTLEQERINYSPDHEGTLESRAGGNVTCVAATFFLGERDGPHDGNYNFEFLVPYNSVTFGDTSSVKAESIGLKAGDAKPSSFGPSAGVHNEGQVTAGSLVGCDFNNRGILTVGEISALNYSSTHSNVGSLTNTGGSTVKVQKKENTERFESEDVGGGEVNASTIDIDTLNNKNGGTITAGTIIANRISCDGSSILEVAEIQVTFSRYSRGSFAGTIKGCSSLIILDVFTSEEGKLGDYPFNTNTSLLQGEVTIGELVATNTTISNIAGSIGTARLRNCGCNVNWRAMGTTPEFFYSSNQGDVDNAKFYNSDQISAHITNCTFLGGLCRAQCYFSEAITFNDTAVTINIDAIGLGSHTVSISKSSGRFACSLGKIQIDEDGDGIIDTENFLSIDIVDSNLEISNSVNTSSGGNFTMSNSTVSSQKGSVIASENCTLTDSYFRSTDIRSTKLSATNCHFNEGEIGLGGTMTNCVYEGSGPIAGMTFTSDRFARAYPNVGIVETVYFHSGPGVSTEFPSTYGPYNPANSLVQPQQERVGRPDYGDPYTRSYVFDVKGALIYGAGSYEGVGLQNVTIDMSASTYFYADEEGQLVKVHKEYDVLEFVNCHVDNVTILQGFNVKFTNCMINNYNNKGGRVTLNSCGLIGSSFDTAVYIDETIGHSAGTLAINCEFFGVLASQGTKTTTSSVGEFSDAFISSSSLSTFASLSAGCTNLNSIIFDKGAGFDNFDEEKKLESIVSKSDIEGRVDLTNSTNSGLIFAKDINMKNSINLGVGDMYASNFGWSGGNTNIGFITCSNFSGVMSEGIGPLVHRHNTRDDGKTVVLMKPGGINHSDEMFTYDYGPYYVYSNGVTTLFPPSGSSASSLDADFNISSSSSDKCLPGTINVTESNEYYFNNTRAKTHGWLFHERKQYHFVNVSSGNPLGFVSPLPTGFNYTGSILEGIRDGNRYYAGTVTVMVDQPFDGNVTFESLYATTTTDYRGQLSWAQCEAGGDDGPDSPPPSPDIDDHPHPPPHPDDPAIPSDEDPVPPTIGPGGVLAPNGTLKYASFNKAFGLRIYYVSKKYYRWNPLTQQSYLASDHIFVEGVPFQGTNIGESRSFNNYILDQIIYPSILDEYFDGLATEMGIPRIVSMENQVFIE